MLGRVEIRSQIRSAATKAARRARYGLPLIVAVASAFSASAQTRPDTRPDRLPTDRPADTRPGVGAGAAMDDWNRDRERDRGPMVRDDMDRRSIDRDAMDASGRNDFPSGEVRGAVEANARAAYARANFRRLEHELDNAVRRLQYDFDRSPELADAIKAEKAAWEAYVSARSAALKSVASDPKYQANASLRDEMREQIAQVRKEHADQVPSSDYRERKLVDCIVMQQLVNMATVKLDYAQVVTDMEVAALRNNSQVADARERLMTAGARCTRLRDDFDRTVRNNQELIALRGRIEDARVAVITSEAFRDGAVGAANVSLDYAYYKNRYTYNYNYDGFYPLGGYGGGYGPGLVRY